MKRTLIFVFLLLSVAAYAQTRTSEVDTLRQELLTVKAAAFDLRRAYDSLFDYAKKLETENTELKKKLAEKEPSQ